MTRGEARKRDRRPSLGGEGAARRHLGISQLGRRCGGEAGERSGRGGRGVFAAARKAHLGQRTAAAGVGVRGLLPRPALSYVLSHGTQGSSEKLLCPSPASSFLFEQTKPFDDGTSQTAMMTASSLYPASDLHGRRLTPDPAAGYLKQVPDIVSLHL